MDKTLYTRLEEKTEKYATACGVTAEMWESPEADLPGVTSSKIIHWKIKATWGTPNLSIDFVVSDYELNYRIDDIDNSFRHMWLGAIFKLYLTAINNCDKEPPHV